MWTALFVLAADAPAAATGGGDVGAIVVAAVGALGVIATAFGPVLTEKVKRGRGGPSTPTTPAAADPGPAAPPAAGSGAPRHSQGTFAPTLVNERDSDVFDALEDAIHDLRVQRDAAQAELARVTRENAGKIDQLREELSEARVAIARLQAGRYSA